MVGDTKIIRIFKGLRSIDSFLFCYNYIEKQDRKKPCFYLLTIPFFGSVCIHVP